MEFMTMQRIGLGFLVTIIAALLLRSGWTQPPVTPTPLPPFPTATPAPASSPMPTEPQPFPTATARLPPTPTVVTGAGDKALVVELTCFAEPKWNYLIDVHRGPSLNWGVMRQYVHAQENVELRVIGRDAKSEWYQVILEPPLQEKVGWVNLAGINLYGVCSDLPITDDKPEITATEAPPAPANVPLPDWLEGAVTLTEYDRAWLIKPDMLYIRRTIPHPEDQKQRVQAHILIMDLDSPHVRISTTIGAVPGVGGVPVSQMARASGAFAAITGDFYAGNYFPQGITVIDSQIVTAPKFRSAFGITHDKKPFIGYFTTGWTWPAYVAAENGEVIPLQLMNVPCEPLWLCLYTHHMGGRLPTSYGGVRVLMDGQFKVIDIVNGEGIDIPEGYYVLRGGDATGQWLLDNVNIGDTLEVVLPTDPPWQDFQTIISGGPRLLIDGELWEDCYPEAGDKPCEEFDFDFRDSHYGLKSLPRAAVGYNAETNLVYAIVTEGYEVEDSGGVTRRELADLFLEFGANQAMEFDGGGSATMFVSPSTLSDYGYEGERRISNALLFFWDE